MAKVLTGKVVSTKMQNTVVVSVERAYQHPVYRKTIRRSKKYKAHVDADMKVLEGNVVDITECRPLSREKTFKVTKIHTTS
jgi:small subunit ribosomal protein S17